MDIVALGHQMQSPEGAIPVPVCGVADDDGIAIGAEADLFLSEQDPLCAPAAVAISVSISVPIPALSDGLPAQCDRQHQRSGEG
jgi:hypothetical protein